MARGRAAPQLDLSQGKRERNCRKRDKHQDPENVHIGEQRSLRLHLLANPGYGLLLCLEKRAALGGEIARSTSRL
jgi:hypothetical protein